MPVITYWLPDGDTEVTTGGGISVTVADALLVLSATLDAVTVTVCEAAIVEGAVYDPRLIVPVDGLMLQVTAVLVVLATVAAKVRVSQTDSVAVAGLRLTLTVTVGIKVTVAVASLVPSATLVAVTVTFCEEAIVDGAV